MIKFTPEMLAEEFGNNELRLFRSFNPDEFPLDFERHSIKACIDHTVTFQSLADRLNELINRK